MSHYCIMHTSSCFCCCCSCCHYIAALVCYQHKVAIGSCALLKLLHVEQHAAFPVCSLSHMAMAPVEQPWHASAGTALASLGTTAHAWLFRGGNLQTRPKSCCLASRMSCKLWPSAVQPSSRCCLCCFLSLLLYAPRLVVIQLAPPPPLRPPPVCRRVASGGIALLWYASMPSFCVAEVSCNERPGTQARFMWCSERLCSLHRTFRGREA